MQHIASPLQSDKAFDTTSTSVGPTDHDFSMHAQPQTHQGLAPVTPGRRIEGPDLSGAIERVLAWHRSRSRH